MPSIRSTSAVVMTVFRFRTRERQRDSGGRIRVTRMATLWTLLAIACGFFLITDTAQAGCYRDTQRGHASARAGKLDRAIAHYTKAIKRCPKNLRARFGRGHVHFTLGEFDRVIDDYGWIAEARPMGWSNARKGLAWALHKTGRSDEAILHAEAAVAMRPGDVRAQDTLANVYAAVGRNLEAAVIYEELGKYQEAVATWRAEWNNGLWRIKAFQALIRLRAFPIHLHARA